MVTTLSFTPENNYSRIGLRYFIDRYGFFTSRDSGTFLCGALQAETEDDVIRMIHERVRLEGYPILGVSSEPPYNEDALFDFFPGPGYVSGNTDTTCDEKKFDLFNHLGFCLTGGIEHTWQTASKEKRHAIVRTAFADTYCELLFDAVKNLHSMMNVPLVHTSFWPENTRFSVCLTHDVDEVKKTYQWITRPWNHVKKRNLQGLYQQFRSLQQKIRGLEPYWTFESLRETEEDLGVKSSLYFLNETGSVSILDKKTWRHVGRRYNWNERSVTELIKSFHSRGWEVGLHGSFHSYKDPEKIQEEKSALEQIIQDKIAGGRQHNLNLAIPETWKYQEAAGLVYDTTLGYNDCIGFRWGTCLPFRPWYHTERRMLNILEIPLIIEDLPFFRIQNRKKAFLHIAREVERHQGVLTLLWHHSVMNEHEYPGWGEAYKHMIEYCKKRNAWITSAREIATWWQWRMNTRFDWSFKDKVLKLSPYPHGHHHYLTIRLPETMKCIHVHNAEIIHKGERSLMIRSEKLKPGDCVQIECEEKR